MNARRPGAHTTCSRLVAWLAALLATLLAIGGVTPRAEAAVSLTARVDRSAVTVGESVSLEVIIEGAGSDVSEPTFDVPDGLQVLGSARSQNFTWVNGRSTTQTVFRFEVGAVSAGSFTIGPIRAHVGEAVYEAPEIAVSVSSEHAPVTGGGDGPAALMVDVGPRDPYVGQPVILRVRLVQRAPLAEDPRYSPPPTPGFWAERFTQPESYYGDQGSSRVLVTETRVRLYPLAAGPATVGEASAILALALPADPMDRLRWPGGFPPRREVEVRSRVVSIRARALPAGAPAGFEGAVGRFTAAWSADRRRTTRDVPFTVRLDLRGVGNLPLIRTPAFGPPGIEVFSSTVEDSLGRLGSLEPGRRGFAWTVVAKREGRVIVPAPDLVWFDPIAATYRRIVVAPIAIDVGPPILAGAASGETFPAVFTHHPLDPFAVPAKPWGLAIAGVLAGLGLRVLRRRPAPRPETAEPTWVEGLRHGVGTSFWAAAERACQALAERGVDVASLKRQVSAVRYGGVASPKDEGVLRAELLKRLAAHRPRPKSRLGAIAGAALALLLAAAVAWWSAPRSGPDAPRQQALRADGAARVGDVAAAVRDWRDLWRRGSRASGLAARLAWSEAHAGAAGAASAWVLLGEGGEPRDPALGWVTRQVREAGGLAGYTPVHLPARSVEWGLGAFACGLLLAFAGRIGAWVCIALAAALAAAPEVETLLGGREERAVVVSDAVLEGAGVELVPGQVVVVLERREGRARIRAGRGVGGWVAEASLAGGRRRA
jgi:hypothetical protein